MLLFVLSLLCELSKVRISMTNHSLSVGQRLLRLALVGGIPLVIALLFLWAGGWLVPRPLSADKLVDVLRQSGGEHPGYRRNHAKGMCVLGEFESNGQASALSRAQVFASGKTPVTGRLAIAGGNPNAPDYAVPVRSLALDFQLINGQQWRTGMNALPFFPVATVGGFYEQQEASRPNPATGKPDPRKMQAFLTRHPEAKPFLAWVKQYTPSSSWVTDRYNSLNAFVMTNAQGKTHVVRWSMVPRAAGMPIANADKQDPLFLQKDLTQRLAQGPAKWDLVIILSQPGDSSNDASQAWPTDRQTINAGTLVIYRATPQLDGPCNNINYDPLILPDGIRGSDDPLLNARSSAYAKSYDLRTREESKIKGDTL